MTFSSGPISRNPIVGGSVPPLLVIPADRITTWQPGVTFNGGIPNRTTISTTLSPLTPATGGPTVTISIATPAVVTLANHGFVAGTSFLFETTGALPTGIAASTLYFVIAAGLAANTFEFSLSSGGAAVNTTGSQSGTQSIVLDDTPQIQTAIDNCLANQVVKLTAGVFRINNPGLNFNGNNNNITLRGVGPGAGLSTGINGVPDNRANVAPGTFTVDATATQLVKWDRKTELTAAIMGVGFGTNTAYTSQTNLAVDAVKGTFSCTLSSNPGLSVGQCVLINMVTDFIGQPQTVTISIASPAVITLSNHGRSAGDSVYFHSTGALPTGITANTGYFVISSGLTTNSFEISATLNGPAINTTGTQSGVHSMAVQVNHPDVYWGPNHDKPCVPLSTRGFDHIQDAAFPFGGRSIGQIMRVSNINGNVITFETPFHITFQTIRIAQLWVWFDVFTFGVGIEEMFIFGGQNNNIGFGMCASCWVKHVESMWSYGSAALYIACYRCEVRDSFMHETGVVDPGGAGYVQQMSYYNSDCLVENNIMWYGNKVNTVPSSGGGNVIAYNYLDDAFGGQYPQAPEAGVNAGHRTTTYMTLIEGNYSHNFKGDAFWGGSPYTTVLRNHISAIRAAHPPLDTYLFDDTVHNIFFPFKDLEGRQGVDLQSGSFKQNFVGNIIGKQGQSLLSYSSASYSFTQTAFAYEDITALPAGDVVYMWSIGFIQDSVNGNSFDSTAVQTQLRNGNWDWVTAKQIWYANIGDSGTTSTGPVRTIPNSYYLTNSPAFFGSHPWPWVNPSTGIPSTLPAKARFDANDPNNLSI